jgi:hypothetical protein
LPTIAVAALMTFRRSCSLAVLGVAWIGTAACGDFEVRRRVSVEGVPALLQGEWQGTWQSDTGPGDGALTIRITEFAGEPVVRLAIDNPCLPSSDYELDVQDDRVLLRLDGHPAMVAQFASLALLVGSYACDEGAGTWQAARIGDLPPPSDLGGSWRGELQPPGVAAEPLRLDLVQRVEAGALLLDGTLDLPTLLPAPLPVRGVAHFGATDFEIVLETDATAAVELVLSGAGEREPPRVDFGLLQVLSGTALPFTQATFRLERMP